MSEGAAVILALALGAAWGVWFGWKARGDRYAEAEHAALMEAARSWLKR